MATTIDSPENRSVESVLRRCIEALRRVAAYRLPEPMDRRLLQLSEAKDSLTPAEREELLALVELAQGRTVEKLEAQVALQQLDEVLPHLFDPKR